MKICVGGEGAFGVKHLEALTRIEGVEVASLVGGDAGTTRALAETWKIPHWTTRLEEALDRPGVEAVILATPTPLHAAQALTCLSAGKHVLIEIPMADNLADCERILALQKRTGLVAMVGHTRRFNPSHQWLHGKLSKGELRLQHLVAQTFFFRRTNINALGRKRTWTDHLLWHHACHTVDLFLYQTAEPLAEMHIVQGPLHPELGIAMDISIQLKSRSGALCTLALSFNNKGPLGTDFRYICDGGTYVARYDELRDGEGSPVDLSGAAVSRDGLELQDREFLAAIREKREPNASVGQCLAAMRILDQLEQRLSLTER